MTYTVGWSPVLLFAGAAICFIRSTVGRTRSRDSHQGTVDGLLVRRERARRVVAQSPHRSAATPPADLVRPHTRRHTRRPEPRPRRAR